MKTKIILFLLFGIDAIVLLLEAKGLSISASEAHILYGNVSFLQYMSRFFLSLFSNHDIGLRFFMILLHFASALLLYLISSKYLQQERNRIWLIAVFLLLPGSISSALIVSHASVIIFGLFLYIYFLVNGFSQRILNLLLFVYLFIEPGFSYLFLALGFYNIYVKQAWNALFSFFLYCSSILIYGFVAHGIPRGHFLDVLGVYSAIFSPIVFIYIFYTLYKLFLLKKMDQIWFIASTAFLVSIILSFRQRINLEYFAPYLMIVLPLSAQIFIQSYRVRLRIYRKKYKIAFILAFVFLVLNAFIVFFHKEIYLVLENPKKNFAYNVDIVHNLAKKLKAMHVKCLHVNNKDMQLRLRFYGIEKCNDTFLKEISLKSVKKGDVTISYKNKILYKADVTKLNNK